ncbi:hypothetical protein Pcac1_g29244 [Phytophthora cactorum]|nr:hypothetical protein Pcac1_g29244 [Phytophthora cactorum]
MDATARPRPPASTSSTEPTSTRGSSRMQMVLEERELWEVTKWGSEAGALPDRGGSRLFRKKSRKALAIVCLAMEDSQLPLVRSAKDAHDAWSRLKGHFEKKSLANKLFLRRRFFTTMMDEGDGCWSTSTRSRRWRNSSMRWALRSARTTW